MQKDCNLPKPGRRFMVRSTHDGAYVIVDPDGREASEAIPFRASAQYLRDKLQREADARARRGARACMCCGHNFTSEGIHNRLCGHCRQRGDGGSMGIAANSTGKVRRAARS